MGTIQQSSHLQHIADAGNRRRRPPGLAGLSGPVGRRPSHADAPVVKGGRPFYTLGRWEPEGNVSML